MVYFDRFYEEPAIARCGWYVASGFSLINLLQQILLGSAQDKTSSSCFGKE